MVDYNIVCNEIAKRVESGELSSEEAQSIMEKADAMYGDGELLTENYKDAISEKLSDAMIEYNTTKGEVKEYVRMRDYDKASASLKKLLTSLRTIKDEIKATKPDTKGAATLVVVKSIINDALTGGWYGAVLGAITGSGDKRIIKGAKYGATVGATIGTACKAIKQASVDGKVDSSAFDKGKQAAIECINDLIVEATKALAEISTKVGKGNAKKDEDSTSTNESVDDIKQAFNDIDAYLEGCSGCKDKEKSDDECCDKKKKKSKKSDEVTEAVIDAIAERIEAVTEAYLDDKIDEDEYNECMTLLDINNYDCF